jgi:hypothetical protein
MLVRTPTPERVKKTRARTITVAVVAVVIGVGYFAFRMIWGLMMLGYVDSAIVRMRALSAAEAQFAKTHPELGYTCSFLQLPSTDETVMRIAKNQIVNGYAFDIVGCQAHLAAKPNATYYLTARPLHSGQPAYCSDQSGILKADYDGSAERCRTSGVPL